MKIHISEVDRIRRKIFFFLDADMIELAVFLNKISSSHVPSVKCIIKRYQ